MTYIVVLTQSGGCDYTIGCGILVEQLSAKNLTDAAAEAEDLVKGYTGEQKLSGAHLYEVHSSIKIDVTRVYADLATATAAAVAASREAAERAQLVALQAKYGKKS